jgi:hypothetical protein
MPQKQKLAHAVFCHAAGDLSSPGCSLVSFGRSGHHHWQRQLSRPLEVCRQMNPKKACAAWTSDDLFAGQAAKVCLGQVDPRQVTALSCAGVEEDRFAAE